MSRYGVVGSATNTAAQTVIEIANNGTNRRLFLEELTVGASGSPGDQASEYQLRRTTGLNGPASTAVTPFAIDQADQAAVTAAWENPDVEPTYATGAILELGLQLRSPFRWVPLTRRARPAVPASTGAGWGLICNVVSSAWTAHVTMTYEE